MAKGDFAKQSFTAMPTWAKGLIGVAVVGGVAFIAWKLYKGAQGFKEDKGNRQEDVAVNKELDKLNTNVSTKQTLSNADALAISNKLFTAMDGIGTDTDTIQSQLMRLQNQADWLAVRAAYGTRTLNSGILFVPDYTGTLEGALSSELGSTDTDMRKKVNDYFKTKGITAII